MSAASTDVRFIYVTIKDAAEARTLAKTLLSERLIACANILPQIESVYEWQGKVHCDPESVLILKTTVSKVAATIKRVEELHPYETPCALTLAIESGAEKYLGWLHQQL